MTLARCCPLPTSRWLPPALVGMSAPHWTDSCNGGNSDISERTVHGLEYSLKTSARNWVSLNYPDGKKPKVRRVSHVTPDNLPPGGGDKFSPLAPNSTAGNTAPASPQGRCLPPRHPLHTVDSLQSSARMWTRSSCRSLCWQVILSRCCGWSRYCSVCLCSTSSTDSSWSCTREGQERQDGRAVPRERKQLRPKRPV